MLSALNSCLRKAIWNEVTRTACCQPRCSRHYSSRDAVDDETKYNSPLKHLLDNAATYEDLDNKNPNNKWATHPYPAILRRHIEEESGVDPSEACIILFPGQGTQFIGMGRDLLKFPEAKELFSLASEVVGVDLINIVSQEDLNRYSQELIVVSSLAAIEKLREERPTVLQSCAAAAGFSLGEITALIFAGAIPVEQGLRLVSIRSAAMDAASKENPGGMLSILYSPDCNVKQACAKAVENCVQPDGERKPFCKIANYLFPQTKVLSGSEEALRYIESNAKELGIRRTKRLKVAGPFHSEAMASAMIPVKQALRMCDVTAPQIRVMSGVDGKHYRDAKHIHLQLPKQIVTSVRWEQLMHNLYSRPNGHNFPRTFEVGPGHTLRTILRQVNAKAWDKSFSVSV